MRVLYLVILLGVFCSGCFGAKGSLPTVLTQKEMMWTIPAGQKFTAIQKPAYPKPTEFVVADDDLAVLYKGNLLEVEKEANRRAVKQARTAKTQGAVLGIIGSILALIAGAVVKKTGNPIMMLFQGKKKEKKTKKK
jgi:hypothetical protein